MAAAGTESATEDDFTVMIDSNTCKLSNKLCKTLQVSIGTEMNVKHLSNKIVQHCMEDCKFLLESNKFYLIPEIMEMIGGDYLSGTLPSFQTKWNLTFEWSDEDRKLGEYSINSDSPVSFRQKSFGFSKLHKVSDELCEFVGVPKGTEISRSFIISNVVNYIKNKDLMDGSNKIKTTDPSLNKLLGINESFNLSILNIQSYLNKHFIENSVVESAGAG